MNRTICTLLLTTVFALSGCGGKNGENGGSNSGPSAGAQVGIEVNVAAFMSDPLAKSALDQAPVPLPPFVNDISKATLYVKIKGEDFDLDDPNTFDFHATIEFANADSAKAMFGMISQGAPDPTEKEVNGITYTVATMPGGPTLYGAAEGSKVLFGTEAMVSHKGANYGTAGLNSAMSSLKEDGAKIAIDLKSAPGILDSIANNIPDVPEEQIAPFKSATAIKFGLGTGKSGNLLSLGIEAADEESAEKIHTTINGLTALAKLAGGSAVDKEAMPASHELLTHVLSELTPKHDGTSVSLAISAPSNFQDLMKKVQDEAKKMQGGNAGFPGKNPNFNGPEKFKK